MNLALPRRVKIPFDFINFCSKFAVKPADMVFDKLYMGWVRKNWRRMVRRWTGADWLL